MQISLLIAAVAAVAAEPPWYQKTWYPYLFDCSDSADWRDQYDSACSAHSANECDVETRSACPQTCGLCTPSSPKMVRPQTRRPPAAASLAVAHTHTPDTGASPEAVPVPVPLPVHCCGAEGVAVAAGDRDAANHGGRRRLPLHRLPLRPHRRLPHRCRGRARAGRRAVAQDQVGSAAVPRDGRAPPPARPRAALARPRTLSTSSWPPAAPRTRRRHPTPPLPHRPPCPPPSAEYAYLTIFVVGLAVRAPRLVATARRTPDPTPSRSPFPSSPSSSSFT